MSAASSPTPSLASPRVSNLQDPARLAQSYRALLDEYARVRAQNAILRRGLVEEQSLAKQLQADAKVKEVEIRRTKEDLDLYKLQSEKLARTVRVLQQDLSSKRSAKEAPRDEWSEQQESIEQILGEFQKKSEQAENLTRELRSERSRIDNLEDLLKDSRATNDRLSAQLQSLESNLTSLQSHLAEAERKRQDLENERDDLASRGSAEARRLAARVLVVRAEVLATERPRYGANYLLQPIFRDFGEIMESCSEPGSRVVEAARELAESAAIFDGVLGSGDASIDEESAAVTQLARRAEEFALSAPEALRELAGRYVRKLNEIAPGAAVAWAARSASLALLVDLYAKFEADPVGEAISRSIQYSDEKLEKDDSLNSLLDSLRLSVADLEAAAAGAAKLEIELEEARTRADIAVAELSSAKTRTIPDLEKRLATAEADVVKLSSDLRNANEKLANETARLEGDLAMIGEETARLVHEVETLSTSLEETENKLEHRTTELRDSRGELDALRSKLAEREEWTKRLEGEVRTLKKQLKEGVVKSVVSSPADAVSPEEITDVKATAILDGAPIPLAHMTRDQLEARVGYLSELLQEADGKLFACTMELNRVRG